MKAGNNQYHAGRYRRPTEERPCIKLQRRKPMSWLKFLFSFDGHISRRTFWLHLMLPLMALNIMVAVLAPPLEFNKYMTSLWVASVWPYFAVGAKRCHDRGRSGWFQLIWLIPVVGPFWLLCELGLVIGTPGPNRFGPGAVRAAP